MDAPVDFTLDRTARLLTASSLGTYETGFNDVNHSSGLGRSSNGGAPIQDMGRVGTPSSLTSLGQYQNRYMPPSLAPPGVGYSTMNSFLGGSGGGSAMGDHLKSLIPELQQYWNTHGDSGCGTRYIVNNNTIYSPYLPYLPATDSLSLFAQNVGVGSGSQAHAQAQAAQAAQAAAYHRIYDLQKEAAMFAGLQHGSPPSGLFGSQPSGLSPPSSRATTESSYTSASNSSNKKDNTSRHSDIKRASDIPKHSIKSIDSHSKGHQGSKAKDTDKKSDSKKHSKTDKKYDVKDSVKIVVPKSDVTVDKTHSNVIKTSNVTGENCKTTVSPEKLTEEKVCSSVDGPSAKKEKVHGVKLPEGSKREKSKKVNEVKSLEVVKTKELIPPTLTVVTNTSNDSVTSSKTLQSPGSEGTTSPMCDRNALSPGTQEKNEADTATTNTTFSLPYYHSIYSHSQPPTVTDGKKVHAPTFTPEIGTLPSVISVATLPFQTTACDMRIKKEKGTNSCCKAKSIIQTNGESNKNSSSENVKTYNVTNPLDQKKIPKRPVDGKDNKTKRKTDTKEVLPSNVAEVKVLKTIPVTEIEGRSIEDETHKNKSHDEIKKPSDGNKIKDGCTSEDSKASVIVECSSNKFDSTEETEDLTTSDESLDKECNKVFKENGETHDKSNHDDRTSHDEVSSKKIPVSKSEHRQLLKSVSPPVTLETITYSHLKHHPSHSKLSDKVNRARTLAKKGGGKKNDSSSGMNIPIGIAVAQKRADLKDENADQDNTHDEGSRGSSNTESRTNGTSLHRIDGQPSAFAGPIISKASSPNGGMSDMRNTLPANLIVTGSASGTGIAWSDDPTARHFGNPWLQSGHGINPSQWLGQMPFPLPTNIPTSTGSDPSHSLSVPPGYKLVQDSVTGQLMIMQSSNLDVYDPSRLWTGGFQSTPPHGTFQQFMAVHQQTQLHQQVLAQHPDRQPTAEFAMAVQQYQQQLQTLCQQQQQNRQDTGSSETCNAAATQPSLQDTGSSETCNAAATHPSIQSDQTKIPDSNPTKEIQVTNKSLTPSNEISTNVDKEKQSSSITPHNQDVNIQIENHSIPFQYPANSLIVHNNDNTVPSVLSTPQEHSSVKLDLENDVQSRGTSPMVPATEIDETAQEAIDAAPNTTESSCDIGPNDVHKLSQGIAPVHTTTSDVSCCTVQLTSTKVAKAIETLTTSAKEGYIAESKCDNARSVGQDVKAIECSNIPSTVFQCMEEEKKAPAAKLVPKGTSENKGDNKKDSIKDKPEDETKTEDSKQETETLQKSGQYNPFLDPQILIAADGLELLSMLAEQRSKCLDVKENTCSNNSEKPSSAIDLKEEKDADNKSQTCCVETSVKTDDISSAKTVNSLLTQTNDEKSNEGEKDKLTKTCSGSLEKVEIVSPKAENISKAKTDTATKTKDASAKSATKTKSNSVTSPQQSETPKPKKRLFSRTRSVPAKTETPVEVIPSYYTSTGLRIPQGEEEINAIELDMRIRLAELQRLYKEKQRQLAKLHPKRDKDSDSSSKRGPGRPRKKCKHASGDSSPKSESSGKSSAIKSKDPSSKKKKQAEELVDRVFRKTGGGFGMPLSKKLKANAMAALFKTQSGFTMKRKGSTSSASSGTKTADCGSSENSSKLKRPFPKTLTLKTLTSNKDQSKEKREGGPSETHKKKVSSDKVMMTPPEESKQLMKPKKTSVQKETDRKPLSPTSSESGLGMMAKYASMVHHEQASPPKKPKIVKQEGACVEESVKKEVAFTGTSPSHEITPTKTEHDTTTIEQNLSKTTPVVAAKRESESESTQDSCSSSGNKKRKPGRPRKCNPNTTPGVTETIVAKNSKNFFYQFHSFEDVVKAHSNTVSLEKKVKIENPSTMKPLFLDEEWLRRRSERIFLSEPSPQPSPNTVNKDQQKSPSVIPSIKKPQPPSPPSPHSKTTPTMIKSKSEKAKLQKAKNIKELTQKVKRKYNNSFHNKKKSKDKENGHAQSRKRKEKSKMIPRKEESSDSEGDNIPLSLLRERPPVQETRSCVVNKEELEDGLRVLVFKDGLFYEGAVQGIRPPDVYGVLIDNERGNRPIIYSQEEILKEVIIDVKPSSSRFLTEGKRICAYWSQQFSCLYPGTIAKASPNPHSDTSSVSVEFDDGDSGRIPLDHVRMLPTAFPLVSYDPNPLLLIGKRRRHTTNESVDNRKSHSSVATNGNSESGPKLKRGPGRPPKVKKEDKNSEDTEDEEEEVDVCGFDDDNDDVFTSGFSMENFRKERAKSSSKAKEVEKKNQKRSKQWDSDNNNDPDKESSGGGKKRKGDKSDSDTSSEQAFLPARQLWRWSGTSTKRPGLKGRAKKEYYKSIVRGKERIMVGDCAVFLSTGRPHLPYIGRIDSMWEAWGGRKMVVKVKWFYHPEETRGGKKLQDMKGALFQSLHYDENDIQTISHKCEVVSFTDFRQKYKDGRKRGQDVYYLGGTYEPTIGLLKFEKDMDI